MGVCCLCMSSGKDRHAEDGMSSAEPNEGDSSESFVDVCECEDGQEQNAESSQKEKSLEESERERRALQAEGDREEEESWETVPENEKDSQEDVGVRNETGEHPPESAERIQTSDGAEETKPGNFLEATNEGDQNKNQEMLSPEDNSHHPRRSAARPPEECQEGGEETQTNTYEENTNSEQTCDGDLEEQTRGYEELQETTADSEPSKPEQTQETTADSEPSKPEQTQETTAVLEPPKPEQTQVSEPPKPEQTQETTAESEPPKPEQTQETTAESEPPKPEDTQESTAVSEPPKLEDTQKTTAESEPPKPEQIQETTVESEPDNPENKEVTQETQSAEQEISQLKPEEHPTAENSQLDPEDEERSRTWRVTDDGRRFQKNGGEPEGYKKENSEIELQHEGEQEESRKDHCEETWLLQSVEPQQRAELTLHMRAPRTGEASYQYPAPAETLWTVHRDSAITLRMEESGTASIPPLTVPEFFSKAVMKFGQQAALCVRRGDNWKSITYLQYEEQCRMVARGLLGLGLARFSGVLILGRSSPQWFIAQIGAIMAGGVAVGIDPSCNGSSCLGAALDSQTQVVMVQDGLQRQKILEVSERLSELKAIVQWEGPVDGSHPLVYTWQELMDLGIEVEESRLHGVTSHQTPGQCCAMVYDGTTELRGVLLSHDDVTWTCRALAESLGLGSEERVVSYLPPSHMTAQMFDLWLPLCCGGRTCFTESDDLKGSLLSMLKAVHPTYFLGFPQLWEKVRRKWTSVEMKATPLQKTVLRWARGKGLRACRRSGPLPWGYSLAERLVFGPARQALGLDRCVHCYAGTEPVAQDMAEYYGGLGVELLDLRGLNETSGVHGPALLGR